MYEVPQPTGSLVTRATVIWVLLTSMVSGLCVVLILVERFLWWISLEDRPLMDLVPALLVGIVPPMLYTTIIVVRAYSVRRGQKPPLGASIIYWVLSIPIALYAVLVLDFLL